MKRLVFLFTLLAFVLVVKSQDGYHPLLKDGKAWHEESLTGPADLNETIMTLRSTTSIEGKNYFNLYVKSIVYKGVGFESGKGIVYAEEGEESDEILYAYLREENGKVYINKDAKERLLYDFTLQKGQELSLSNTCKLTVDSTDVLLFDANAFRCMFVTESDMELYDKMKESGVVPEEAPQYWSKSGIWMEGLGSSSGLLQPYGWVLVSGLPRLTKCYEDRMLIYESKESAIHQTSGIEQVRPAVAPNYPNFIFDLQGRRINRMPAKGLYIQGGKKYVK